MKGDRSLRAIVVLVMVGMAFSSAFSQAPPTEMDMCRQQLATTHDSGDARERKMALAMAEQHAAAEARAATLIGWLKAAQEGGK